MSDSNKSLFSASVGQDIASDIVHELLYLISSSVTASAPNINQNGEKFVAQEVDVL
jgi:hypothetical protein